MDDIELIKSKINIVDLVQEYLPLKKSGVNFKAPCPFHQEKTPSFVVSPERGIFHCFGCQKGGDIFRFLMEKEGMDFPESLQLLAQKAGVILKRTKNTSSDKRHRLMEANLKSAQFFHHLLTKHSLGKVALKYLKNRGLNESTIKEFNLGYAPNSWESLVSFLKKRGFKVEEALEAGLIVASQKGGYDRFRGRVMFPLVDVTGSIRGFAGRVLGAGEPKYINTPQTTIFDKSEFLFGLNLAKGEIRQAGAAILVEGEMDMITSYQAGVKNIVASKGTALTLGQLELLKKYTDTLLICFDKDLAGDAASRRGIELADKVGFNLKVISLPSGKDPAELALKDPEQWEKQVIEAEPIYDYYLKSVSRRFSLSSAEGKKRASSELLPIWAKITDPINFEHYLQKLSALISTPENVLRGQIDKVKESGTETVNYSTALRQADTDKVIARPRRELLEEYLLVLLLKIPSDLTFVPSFPETLFTQETYRSLYVLLVLYLDSISFKGGSFSILEFVKSLPVEVVPLTDRLYLLEVDDKLSSSKNWQSEIEVVIGELKKALVKASLEKLSAQIKNAQSFGKIQELDKLNKRFRDLSVRLKGLN